jgi:hypothetical protein
MGLAEIRKGEIIYYKLKGGGEMRYGKLFMFFVALLLSVLLVMQADAKGRKVVIPAPVPLTGQTSVYSTGDDGNLQIGVDWPVPRFTDKGDGTVRDNLTGLIWLKNADCFGEQTWADALNACKTLASPACGLTDGSIAGDWRLPNIKELQSLIDFGSYEPALPNTAGTGKWSEEDPFTGVLSDFYWSSTTYAPVTTSAWRMLMQIGRPNYGVKTEYIGYHVWPVRGGQ